MIGDRRAFGIYLLTDEQIELANKNGINEHTLNARLCVPPLWDLERALNTPVRKWGNWMIGPHTLTDDQMKKAEELGLKKATVRNRIEALHWNVNKAVSTKPVRHKTKWTIEDLIEAEENGISRSTFKARVKDLGYTVEEAKTEPVTKTGRGYQKWD